MKQRGGIGIPLEYHQLAWNKKYRGAYFHRHFTLCLSYSHTLTKNKEENIYSALIFQGLFKKFSIDRWDQQPECQIIRQFYKGKAFIIITISRNTMGRRDTRSSFHRFFSFHPGLWLFPMARFSSLSLLWCCLSTSCVWLSLFPSTLPSKIVLTKVLCCLLMRPNGCSFVQIHNRLSKSVYRFTISFQNSQLHLWFLFWRNPSFWVQYEGPLTIF